VTPMRVSEMPRCSQRPMNLTSSSRPTETKTLALLSYEWATILGLGRDLRNNEIQAMDFY
jgi:hypothetical protein